MTLNLAQFAGLNREAAPVSGAQASGNGQRADRPQAEYWLNFGYPKSYVDADGNEQVSWVSLGLGIPLDQVNEFDITDRKVAPTPDMATLRQRQNKFRDGLLAKAKTLAPGEAVIVSFDKERNTGMELRRRAGASAPSVNIDDENDFAF